MIFQCLFFYKIACILNNFKLRQICVFSIKKNMEIKKNIVLLGMMGSGKSTIGNLLAKKLNRVLIDIDRKIEKMENLKINQIFKVKGETYFRELEFKMTNESLKDHDKIISLGGGAFMNKKLRNSISKNAVSVWLDVNLKTLSDRLKWNQKRPMLKKNNNKKELEELYSQRKNIYKLANHKVICDKLDKQNIAEKVIEIYEKY